MGNAGGREAGENGADDPSERSDGHQGFPPVPGRSVDEMGNSPPESPGRSRSPLLFAPQDYFVVLAYWYHLRLSLGLIMVPVAPLQRGADVPPLFNQLCMNESHRPFEMPLEKGIPTLITWNHGGNDVSVEGSWDNWTTRKALQRSGKDHCILLILPSGIYHYKFLVDGELRYIPDLPYVADEVGNVTNLLDVHDYVPENLENVSEFETLPSPDSSYSQPFPVDEDFAKEPPAVPPQLCLTVLGMQKSDEAVKRPQHVVLNHLFIEKGWASQSLVALGLTHRFQSKYVTVVLYKPMRR